MKNMFELWKAKKLPEKAQRHIDASVSFCKSKDERIFKAGFLCGQIIEKDKEIRKELGLDEKD